MTTDPHDAPVAGGNATVGHEAGIAEAMARLRRACAGERPRRQGRSGGSVAPNLPPPSIEYEDYSGPMGWRKCVVYLAIGIIVGRLLGLALGWP